MSRGSLRTLPKQGQGRHFCAGLGLLLACEVMASLGPISAQSSAAPSLGPAPDNVLAQIGSSRTITISAFLWGWEQRGYRAACDSLTPQSARRFLELLADQELLRAEASRHAWVWTRAESAQYAAWLDHLTMRLALDSILAETRARMAARGEGAEDAEALGVEARDSAVARICLTYDDGLIARLTEAWKRLPRPSPGASLARQLRDLDTLPELDAAEFDRVIARSTAGDYRVSDLMDGWRRLSPAYRPRIETPAQLRDLVKNGMFERMVRREADRRRLSERPEVASHLAEKREDLSVSHFVESQVTRRIDHDSLTLRRYFEAHHSAWSLPVRVRLVRLMLSSRTEADRAALQLRDPAAAETLVARGERRGTHYRWDIGAEDDSALFAAAMKSGPGTVVGPEARGDEWTVARVMEILPGRPYRFEEVRPDVEAQWMALESERRLEALSQELRKRTRVVINDRALSRICDHLDARAAQP